MRLGGVWWIRRCKRLCIFLRLPTCRRSWHVFFFQPAEIETGVSKFRIGKDKTAPPASAGIMASVAVSWKNSSWLEVTSASKITVQESPGRTVGLYFLVLFWNSAVAQLPFHLFHPPSPPRSTHCGNLFLHLKFSVCKATDGCSSLPKIVALLSQLVSVSSSSMVILCNRSSSKGFGYQTGWICNLLFCFFFSFFPLCCEIHKHIFLNKPLKWFCLCFPGKKSPGWRATLRVIIKTSKKTKQKRSAKRCK